MVTIKILSVVGLFVLAFMNVSAFAFEDDRPSEGTSMVFPSGPLDDFFVVREDGVNTEIFGAKIKPSTGFHDHFVDCQSQVGLVQPKPQKQGEKSDYSQLDHVDRQTFYLCSFEPTYSKSFWEPFHKLLSITVNILDCTIVIANSEKPALAVVSAAGLPAVQTTIDAPEHNMSKRKIAKFVEDEFQCDYVIGGGGTPWIM